MEWKGSCGNDLACRKYFLAVGNSNGDEEKRPRSGGWNTITAMRSLRSSKLSVVGSAKSAVT